MAKIPVQQGYEIDTQGSPEVYLQQKSFDGLIYRFGYDAYLDKMMICPCKEEGVNSPKLECKNCLGTGWVLFERIKTKVWVWQMNYPTQYKEWSIENIGTAQISTLSMYPLAFMDRIVLFKERNIYTELLYPIQSSKGELFCYCAYPPTKILSCKIFVDEFSELLDVPVEKLIIDEEGKIILDNIRDLISYRDIYINSSMKGISLRYEYCPSYHILDINRNLMTSPTDVPSNPALSKGTRVQFPYSAVGKMSHLILERSNLMNLGKEQISNNSNEDLIDEDRIKNLKVSKEFCDTEGPSTKGLGI